MPQPRRGGPPFAGRYPFVVAIVLIALCPHILLTTAFPLLADRLARELHMTPVSLNTVEGLSNAGYALGAVLAADLIQRAAQRRVFLACETTFVVGSFCAAVAPASHPALLFGTGRFLQGLATGLLLIVALPPLVTRFGVAKLPLTVAFVDLGLFGAVTAGPLLGGFVAGAWSWRWMFVALGLVGAAGAALAALTLEHQDPPAPDLSGHPSAFTLAAVATVLPFLGAARLVDHAFRSPVVWVPVVVGLAALVLLVRRQYRKPDPLMPVGALATMVPIAGTMCAMVAGAVFVTFGELTVRALTQVQRVPPLHAGVLFWPQVVTVIVASVLFGALFRTRHVPTLVGAGLLALIAGGVVLLGGPPLGDERVLVASALLGFGAGATVSPGLFLAGLSVEPAKIGRAFALVELLRAEAGYLLAPIMLHVATTSRAGLAHGVHDATRWTVVVAVVGTAATAAVYLLNRARFQAPDLERWLEQGEPALESSAPKDSALIRS